MGMGGTLRGQGVTTGGLWSVNEQDYHINCLEMLAVAMAVKTFAKDQKNVTILLRTDNIPTRAHINHFGGHIHTPWVELWKWCIERQIFLIAEHLPGMNQPHCRYRVQNCERLDASPSPILSDQQKVWPIGSRSFCITADTPIGSILQLEARFSSRGNRCLHPDLNSVTGICQSPMVPAVTNTGKDPKGKGQSSGDGTFMENSAMVLSSTTAVNWHSPSDSSSTEHCIIPQLNRSSSCWQGFFN